MHAEPQPRPRSDILRAGLGLWRLLCFDGRWVEGFDFSTTGFWRSFYGPLLALPFYVFYFAMAQSTQATTQPGHTISPALLGLAVAEHLVDAFGYILLIALIARPLRAGAGFSAFATVTNWTSPFLNALLAAASLLLLGGQDGLEGFAVIGLMLLCISVYAVWRTAHATLTREIAPILLVVVLSVAWSTALDQATTWAISALGLS